MAGHSHDGVSHIDQIALAGAEIVGENVPLGLQRLGKGSRREDYGFEGGAFARQTLS
jgi:hypothetical protein